MPSRWGVTKYGAHMWPHFAAYCMAYRDNCRSAPLLLIWLFREDIFAAGITFRSKAFHFATLRVSSPSYRRVRLYFPNAWFRRNGGNLRRSMALSMAFCAVSWRYSSGADGWKRVSNSHYEAAKCHYLFLLLERMRRRRAEGTLLTRYWCGE